VAVIQLATSDDVVASLGRALTPTETARVGAILDKASEVFRFRSGQRFTAGTSTVRLKVNGGRVHLPQHPAVSVATVTDDAGATVPFTVFGQWLSVGLSSDMFVTVEYDHGGEVPDVVRLSLADHAARALLIPLPALAGVTQHSETMGPFAESDTYAAWAVARTLSPDDDALAKSFRVKVPGVIVMRP